MKMIALLSAAFYWCYLSGELYNSQKPIPLKSHGRKAMSVFRYGLDAIRSVLFSFYYNVKELNRLLHLLIDRLRNNTNCIGNSKIKNVLY